MNEKFIETVGDSNSLKSLLSECSNRGRQQQRRTVLLSVGLALQDIDCCEQLCLNECWFMQFDSLRGSVESGPFLPTSSVCRTCMMFAYMCC